jgi:hypothetical protein
MFKFGMAIFVGLVAVIIGNVVVDKAKYDTFDAKISGVEWRCKKGNGVGNCSTDIGFRQARDSRQKPSMLFVGEAIATAIYVEPTTRATKRVKVSIDGSELNFYLIKPSDHVRIDVLRENPKQAKLVYIKPALGNRSN